MYLYSNFCYDESYSIRKCRTLCLILYFRRIGTNWEEEIVQALFKTKLKRYMEDLDRAADGSTKKTRRKGATSARDQPLDQTDHKGEYLSDRASDSCRRDKEWRALTSSERAHRQTKLVQEYLKTSLDDRRWIYQPTMAIRGEFVAQRTEMTATHTTCRLGRNVKIPRSQTKGGNPVHRPLRSESVTGGCTRVWQGLKAIFSHTRVADLHLLEPKMTKMRAPIKYHRYMDEGDAIA